MLDCEIIEKFVINLKRRPDRLKAFQEICPLKDVKVIYGFDGHTINEESDKEKELFAKMPLKFPGEIGCFISHLRIYETIIKANIPYALIMEDDAIFSKYFIVKFLSILRQLPSTIDILFIGGRFTPDYYMKSCDNVTANIVKHKVMNNTFIGKPMDCHRTTHAYLISNKMAHIFLNTFHSTQIHTQIDHWILDVCKANTIPIYNTQPLLCHSPIVHDSDIR